MENEKNIYIGSGYEISYKTIGSGPNLIVLSGGPGMSYEYLEASLERLKNHFTITFFDQIGCGSSFSKIPPTLDTTKNSTIAFIKSIVGNEKFYCIAHSWGAFLASEIFGDLNALKPTGTLFLNPTPLDRKGFDTVSGRLIERVSPEKMEIIKKLAEDGSNDAGKKLMSVAMSAYFGRETNLPDVVIEHSIATHDSVSETLGDFDNWSSLASFGKLLLVFGTDDYISSDDYTPYIDSAVKIFSLKTGHFSMIDYPEEIAKIVDDFDV